MIILLLDQINKRTIKRGDGMVSKTWSGRILEMKKRGRGSVVIGKIKRSDGRIVDFRGNLMKGIGFDMDVDFYYDTVRKSAFDIRKKNSRWPSDYQRGN